MKKYVLLGFLLAASQQIFAFINQHNWRWRKDDGSETNATWLAAEKTEPMIITNEPLRLRIELYSDATPRDLAGANLMYSTDKIVWDTVRFIPKENDPFKLSGTSPFVNDLEATTQQLSSSSDYLFQPGKVIVSSESFPSDMLAPFVGTEYEIGITPTAKISPNTTYFFHIRTGSDNFVSSSLATGTSVLGVTLKDFTAKVANQGVKLNWETSSEHNNDFFEIERSNDAKNWKSIGRVKGKGTTNLSSTYSFEDRNPLKGNNYYRFRQYDFDGNSTLSIIKPVNFDQVADVNIIVFPNPAKGAIQFKIGNRKVENILVLLTDGSGNTVHSEAIKNLNPGEFYKLKPSKTLAPGFYFLTLTCKQFAKSIKVIVQ